MRLIAFSVPRMPAGVAPSFGQNETMTGHANRSVMMAQPSANPVPLAGAIETGQSSDLALPLALLVAVLLVGVVALWRPSWRAKFRRMT